VDYHCVIPNRSIVWIVHDAVFQQTPWIMNTYKFVKSNVMGCFKPINEKGEVVLAVPLHIVVDVPMVVDGYVQLVMQAYHDRGNFVLVVEANVPTRIINQQLCSRTMMLGQQQRRQ
jgi:hypothetical protein